MKNILDMSVDEVRDEFSDCLYALCLLCGKDAKERLGVCAGCRWKESPRSAKTEEKEIIKCKTCVHYRGSMNESVGTCDYWPGFVASEDYCSKHKEEV